MYEIRYMKKIIFMFFLVSLGANANEYIGVGGGYDVFHSEASLQSNVMEFEKLTKKEKRKIFFGTGNASLIDASRDSSSFLDRIGEL